MQNKAEVTSKAIEIIKVKASDLKSAVNLALDFQAQAQRASIEVTNEDVVNMALEATGASLPELTGSEKQIAWATSIRIEIMCDRYSPLREKAATTTSAAWLINNR